MVLENNESWFPAISRANRALSTTRRQQESAGAAAEAQVLDVEAEEAAFEGVEVGDDAEEDEEARRRLAAVQAERLAAAGFADVAAAVAARWGWAARQLASTE